MTSTTNSAVTVAEQQYAALETAWNTADGAAYAAPFTEDAAFVDVRGSLHIGRAAIAGGHQGIFHSIYADSVVRYVVEDAAEIAPGVLVAHALAELDAPKAPPMPSTARSTAVLVDTADGWRIAAFHNTLVTG